MCKHGVNLKMIRQDDVPQMQAELIKFAKELKGGAANPASGAHYVAIMGDGAASFLAAIAPTLGEAADLVAHLDRHLHRAPGVVLELDRCVDPEPAESRVDARHPGTLRWNR